MGPVFVKLAKMDFYYKIIWNCAKLCRNKYPICVLLKLFSFFRFQIDSYCTRLFGILLSYICENS